MSEPLDEQYLKWLYSQIGSIDETNPAKTYWKLLQHLYSVEFVWIIPNDDNRVEDGKDLRNEFIEECNVYDVDRNWLSLGCSLLEMLIGLSRRLSFETDDTAREWFWQLLENLELEEFSDARYFKEPVEHICQQLIWRTYDYNGYGGLFPLNHPEEDQRDVEIWYQQSAYILERG